MKKVWITIFKGGKRIRIKVGGAKAAKKASLPDPIGAEMVPKKLVFKQKKGGKGVRIVKGSSFSRNLRRILRKKK